MCDYVVHRMLIFPSQTLERARSFVKKLLLLLFVMEPPPLSSIAFYSRRRRRAGAGAGAGLVPALLALALALVLVLAAVLVAAEEYHPDHVPLYVVSSVPDDEFHIYWINHWQAGELVLQVPSALGPKQSTSINSFNTHSFLLLSASMQGKLTHASGETWNATLMANFTMGPFPEEVTLHRLSDGTLEAVKENAGTRLADNLRAAREACTQEFTSGTCTADVGADGEDGAGSCEVDANPVLSDDVLDCIALYLSPSTAKKDQQLMQHEKLLNKVSDHLRNYTCADPTATLPEKAQREFEWQGSTVRVYHEDDSAKVMILDDFVGSEACDALKARAEGNLRVAEVTGESGSELSTSRRAKAAGVHPSLDDDRDVVTQLYKKGYAFAREMTGYDLPLHYQEGFSVIKYDSTDEYLPHCDGACTGKDYKPGGRVSTIVFYCEAATVGGGTTFSSVDVFVNPKKGQAAFFSYLGSDGKMDLGKTRHSGCPIISGTKWIATLWMRLGLTEQQTWMDFDPSGNPLNALKEQQDEEEVVAE
jgi:hypothetical protein